MTGFLPFRSIINPEIQYSVFLSPATTGCKLKSFSKEIIYDLEYNISTSQGIGMLYSTPYTVLSFIYTNDLDTYNTIDQWFSTFLVLRTTNLIKKNFEAHLSNIQVKIKMLMPFIINYNWPTLGLKHRKASTAQYHVARGPQVGRGPWVGNRCYRH